MQKIKYHNHILLVILIFQVQQCQCRQDIPSHSCIQDHNHIPVMTLIYQHQYHHHDISTHIQDLDHIANIIVTLQVSPNVVKRFTYTLKLGETQIARFTVA